MDAVAVDRRQIGDAALRVAERVADMIRPLSDTSIRIPRSKWTVGEAAAHLAIANGMGVKIASGETVAYGDGTPGGLAPANARFLSEFPDRDGAGLADLIVDRARSFVQTAARQPDTFVAHTPMGAMDARTGTSYMLCHLLMHGCAIAQALRKRYPVEPADVELALPFLLHAMPMIVDEKAAQGLNASYDLRFRGGSRVAIMGR